VRVTGQVLPVYQHPGWQIEQILLDRGTGLREWWEIRHRDTITCLRDRGEVNRMLADHHLNLSVFTPTDVADDGCE